MTDDGTFCGNLHIYTQIYDMSDMAVKVLIILSNVNNIILLYSRTHSILILYYNAKIIKLYVI